VTAYVTVCPNAKKPYTKALVKFKALQKEQAATLRSS
jgi:hypothetical protein